MDISYFVTNIFPVITTVSMAIVGYWVTGFNRRIERVEDDVREIHLKILAI